MSHQRCSPPLPTDVPTLCSQHDTGGGVLYHTYFVIYTTSPLPPPTSPLPPTLLPLATAIALKIPIYFSIPTHDTTALQNHPTLQRISYPPWTSPREIDRLPYFFINAARHTGVGGHCIAGRETVVETLLAVLRRPWCVLELCSSNDEVVRALSEFAEEVDRVMGGYAAAVYLLGHELEARCRVRDQAAVSREESPTAVFRTESPVATRRRPGFSADEEVLRGMREVCAAVFGTSVKSFNGFWLRLICTTAVRLKICFSTVGRMLGDGNRNPGLFEDLWLCRIDRPVCARATMNADIGDEVLADDQLREMRRALEASAARVEMWAGGERDLYEWREEGIETRDFLVRIYARALEELGDTELYLNDW